MKEIFFLVEIKRKSLLFFNRFFSTADILFPFSRAHVTTPRDSCRDEEKERRYNRFWWGFIRREIDLWWWKIDTRCLLFLNEIDENEMTDHVEKFAVEKKLEDIYSV